jgi:hypothetical protein
VVINLSALIDFIYLSLDVYEFIIPPSDYPGNVQPTTVTHQGRDPIERSGRIGDEGRGLDEAIYLEPKISYDIISFWIRTLRMEPCSI